MLFYSPNLWFARAKHNIERRNFFYFLFLKALPLYNYTHCGTVVVFYDVVGFKCI